jgi:dihydrofolate synthase / folylpolyglutamate synthase
MNGPRTLDEWQAYIGRERPADVARGLEHVRAVASRLGVIDPAPRKLVIAGTNGKGSTAVFSEALLQASGLRTGTTLSPHVLAFNERIRLDGIPAEDERICEALAVVDKARGSTTLSYFEFVTLAALWTFRQARVDAVVLEVGLGGRLDAVNVVDGDVAVITSIGLDHQALLGPDRESIGAEKAGILRAGVPLVYGETDMPSSIRHAAGRLHAPVFRFGSEYNAGMGNRADQWWYWSVGGFRLEGLAQPRVALNNAATALGAVSLLLDRQLGVEAVDAASAAANLSGRFQHVVARGRTFVLDVAHNPHAAGFLCAQLRAGSDAGRTVAVAGVLRDKDAAGVVGALSELVECWWFVDTEGERGQTGSNVQHRLVAAGLAIASRAARSLEDAIDSAVAATSDADRILVVGSFNVVQRATSVLRETRA